MYTFTSRLSTPHVKKGPLFKLLGKLSLTALPPHINSIRVPRPNHVVLGAL